MDTIIGIDRLKEAVNREGVFPAYLSSFRLEVCVKICHAIECAQMDVGDPDYVYYIKFNKSKVPNHIRNNLSHIMYKIGINSYWADKNDSYVIMKLNLKKYLA